MRDYKYLLAYLIPLSGFVVLYAQGIWTFLTFFTAFIFIPFVELFVWNSSQNLNFPEEKRQSDKKLFDWMLYLNLPLIYTILICTFFQLKHNTFRFYEYVGILLCVGIILASCGINVGHELGHKTDPIKKFIAKVLLLPSLYMHFIIEHNRGHHKNVGTESDPASAKKNEIVYFFWIRSVIGGYRNAWKIENQRLIKEGLSPLSLKNEMIRFLLIQLVYLTSIYAFFGWFILGFAIGIATISFLILETINYIEHYGLRRKKLSNGRYENVGFQHSWNSNHELGRIMLYELTRHSDHHYKEKRKYQLLRHSDQSPQLPYGYPASMVIALMPPLWFRIMNPLLTGLNQNDHRIEGSPLLEKSVS